MRGHEVGLLHLAIVVCPGLCVAPPGVLSCLGIGPCKVLVAAFLVSFALHLIIAEPFARYLPAVGYVVADLGESTDRTGLQQDGERQNLSHAEYALQYRTA